MAEPISPEVQRLLDTCTYIEQARTLLIGAEGEEKSVVLILGDMYTLWPEATFRRWADRLLKQL